MVSHAADKYTEHLAIEALIDLIQLSLVDKTIEKKD